MNNTSTETKSNRGRTEKHSIDEKNQWVLQICALLRQGYLKPEACKKIGMSPSLFDYWYKVLCGQKTHRPRPDVTKQFGSKYYVELAKTEQERIRRLSETSGNGYQSPRKQEPTSIPKTLPSKKPVSSNGNGSNGQSIANGQQPVTNGHTLKIEVTKANGTVFKLEGNTTQELKDLLTLIED